MNDFYVGANMATVSLSANSRGELVAPLVRFAEGLMPAVIYQLASPQPRLLSINGLENAFRKTETEHAGGTWCRWKRFVCLVKETQRDPVTADLLHVDFFEVSSDEDVWLRFPSTVGKAPGVVAGKLRIIKRDLRIKCSQPIFPTPYPSM